MSLQDAVSQALANHPQLAAGEARIEIARADRKQASLSPNPRLFLQSEDVRPWNSSFNFPNNTEDYGYVGQVLETAGKKKHRVEVASAGLRITEAEKAVLIRQIRFQVSAAYFTALGAQQMRDLYRRSLDTYEQDVEYNRKRVQEGAAAEADLIRIQLERDRVRLQVITSDREVAQAIVELYRAIGSTSFRPVTLTEPLEPDASLQTFNPGNPANRPELQAAQESLLQAQANVRLQRANARPDPDVYFGYKRNSGANTLYTALQIDLPIRNRNQGAIASAEAQVHEARANLQGTQVKLLADTEAAHKTFEAQRALFAELPQIRARADENERIARAAYREGGYDLIRLLDAQRTRIDTEVQYSRALVELRQSILTLQFATGMNP